jgi:DNA-binding FrmR family transcriptional regulator
MVSASRRAASWSLILALTIASAPGIPVAEAATRDELRNAVEAAITHYRASLSRQELTRTQWQLKAAVTRQNSANSRIASIEGQLAAAQKSIEVNQDLLTKLEIARREAKPASAKKISQQIESTRNTLRGLERNVTTLQAARDATLQDRAQLKLEEEQILKKIPEQEIAYSAAKALADAAFKKIPNCDCSQIGTTVFGSVGITGEYLDIDAAWNALDSKIPASPAGCAAQTCSPGVNYMHEELLFYKDPAKRRIMKDPRLFCKVSTIANGSGAEIVLNGIQTAAAQDPRLCAQPKSTP